MMPTMELLQYIYKTADMGCQGIDAVTGSATDKLRDELMGQREEYDRIRDQAEQAIRARGDDPGGAGRMAKLSAEWMSAMQLSMDDSPSKIAEMTIQGATMGIVKTIKHLNDAKGDDEEARDLGRRLLKLQEENVERMKAYL